MRSHNEYKVRVPGRIAVQAPSTRDLRQVNRRAHYGQRVSSGFDLSAVMLTIAQ
jgi:hypothetical protein